MNLNPTANHGWVVVGGVCVCFVAVVVWWWWVVFGVGSGEGYH